MKTFSRVGHFKRGYDPAQVDDFLDRVHTLYDKDRLPEEFTPELIYGATFSLVRRGYDPTQVDDALERLDEAYWQRRRAEAVERAGANGWLNETYDRAASLYPRLSRPHGKRFAPPAKGRGYNRREVDELLDHVSDYFDGTKDLLSTQVRHALFASAKKSDAYDEAVVDVYLDRVTSVLQAVE